MPLRRRNSAASRSRPREPLLGVDEEDDEVRGDDRGVDLLLDVVRQVGAVDDPDSARVDEIERAAFVLHDRRPRGRASRPAVGSTIEIREPHSALSSEDLPTFGRPTIATAGALHS